jgi:hypothetical protein
LPKPDENGARTKIRAATLFVKLACEFEICLGFEVRARPFFVITMIIIMIVVANDGMAIIGMVARGRQ